jgi:hypothetical protein
VKGDLGVEKIVARWLIIRPRTSIKRKLWKCMLYFKLDYSQKIYTILCKSKSFHLITHPRWYVFDAWKDFMWLYVEGFRLLLTCEERPSFPLSDPEERILRMRFRIWYDPNEPGRERDPQCLHLFRVLHSKDQWHRKSLLGKERGSL